MAAPTLTSAVPRHGSAPAWLRTLYADMTDPESEVAPQAVADIQTELRAVAGPPMDDVDLETAAREVRAWSTREAERYRQLWDDTDPGDGGRDVLLRRAVLGCAPLGLVAGAWLQWLTSMAEADDDLALVCLRLYAGDVGAGHASDSRGHAFLALLRDLRLADNASPAAGIALDQRIADRAFYLPALLLLMSRRPEELRPEILGADRCLRAVGLPPPLALVRAGRPQSSWPALDLSSAHGPESVQATELSAAAAARCEPDRVALGFRWAFNAVRAWHAQLRSELLRFLNAAEEMAELVRVRAHEGAVYHQSFPIEGRPLSQWLTEARTDPWPLMGVLSRSKLIRPGSPDRSPLITGLIGERGKMFRVFAPEDVLVIRRWVTSLSGAETRPARETDAAEADTDAGEPPALRWPPAYRSAGSETGKPDLRTAYALLQRRTITPEVRRYAVEYVHGWLGRAGHRLEDAEVMLPQRWPAEGLRPWLAAQHERHAAGFERSADEALPSREALIESSVQLAPLTMIDGAWLQGFTDYELASSPIGFSLFETYWDELGNGEPRLNHPLIYRQLVAGMGHDLPPTGTLEFARWPGFTERSFELPVYWLSIGRFPRTFLPEILGLNLAMELSGVGGSYRRARLALKKYGFDTRFVDLHNTIDNVATGHSAWAADAINTFMAGGSTSTEPALRDVAWPRIRRGFRSLNPPDGRMARWAAGRARRTSRRQSREGTR